jgi:hypothetical protein
MTAALRTPLPTLAMGLAFGLAACGGGSSDSDDVKGLAKQVANSDEKVCDHVTADFLKAVGGTKQKCRQAARQDTSRKRPKVGAVKVDGGRGTAVLTDGKAKATLQLVKKDGDWQIASVR